MPSLLCHSIQHTSQQLAGYLDIPYEEIDWRAAGINHLAWFVELKRDGEDLYPLLREKARIAEIYDQDPVRFEMMLHLERSVRKAAGTIRSTSPISENAPIWSRNMTAAAIEARAVSMPRIGPPGAPRVTRGSRTIFPARRRSSSSAARSLPRTLWRRWRPTGQPSSMAASSLKCRFCRYLRQLRPCTGPVRRHFSAWQQGFPVREGKPERALTL
jgi:hypothetical protein